MSFIDELNRMPPPAKKKSLDEKEIDEAVYTAHESLKTYCTDNRQARGVHGFLIRLKGDREYSAPDSVKCYSTLYQYQYPYRIDIGKPNYFKKNSKTVLQLGDDTYDGVNGPRTAIFTDINLCNKVISNLKALLRKDGFPIIELKAVPVYAALVKQYYKSRLLTADYYEEGQLTNQFEGYVIEFTLKW